MGSFVDKIKLEMYKGKIIGIFQDAIIFHAKRLDNFPSEIKIWITSDGDANPGFMVMQSMKILPETYDVFQIRGETWDLMDEGNQAVGYMKTEIFPRLSKELNIDLNNFRICVETNDEKAKKLFYTIYNDAKFIKQMTLGQILNI